MTILSSVRRGGIGVAVVLAVLVFLVVTALGEARQPPDVPLRVIHRYTEHYEGRRVRLTGSVRAIDDESGRYYVLEDVDKNRILLRTSARRLADHVNAQLTVIGVVGFSEGSGIYLDVESLGDTSVSMTSSNDDSAK